MGGSAGVVVGLLAVVWLVTNTQRLTAAVFVGASPIMADFGITAAVAGLMVSAYFPAYGALQVPLGFVLDRTPPRVLLLWAIGLLGLSNLAFALAPNVEWAIAARVAVGVSSAPVFLTVLKACAELSLREYPKRVGFVVTAGGIGAITGQALLPLLLVQVPWRTVALLLAVEVLLLVPLLALMPLPGASSRAPRTVGDQLAGLRREIQTAGFWWLALPAMLWCGAYFGVLSWLPRYARDVLQSGPALTGILPGLLQVGLVFGASAAGALHARHRPLGPRLYFGGGALFGLLVTILPTLHALGAAWLLYVLAPALGLLFGCFFVWLSLASEIVPPGHLGAVTGLINGLTFLPAFADPPLMGLLFDLIDRPDAPDPTYSSAAYAAGFVALGISALLGVVGGLLVGRGGTLSQCTATSSSGAPELSTGSGRPSDPRQPTSSRKSSTPPDGSA
jgi:predicted MFS family arabinose efflux permease